MPVVRGGDHHAIQILSLQHSPVILIRLSPRRFGASLRNPRVVNIADGAHLHLTVSLKFIEQEFSPLTHSDKAQSNPVIRPEDARVGSCCRCRQNSSSCGSHFKGSPIFS